MPMNFRSLCFAACLGLSTLNACGTLANSEASTVAQGKYYASGNPEFDAFFIALYRLQVEMERAPGRPNVARAELAQSVNVNREASLEQLLARVKEEAERLRKSAVLLRLDVPELSALEPGTEAATLQRSSEPTSDNDKALLQKLESLATELVRTQSTMLASKRQIDQLRSRAITLETQIDQTFRLEGPWKKSEVRENLGDAQKLLTLMTARGDDVTTEVRKLLEPLKQALTTDNGELERKAEPAPAPAPEPAPKKSRASSKRTSSAPQASKPASKPARATPPAPDAEMQAPPKPPPAPAAAPRDFEP